jgi:hypothetical protein
MSRVRFESRSSRQLSASASALAVLGAELQAKVSGKPIHPTLRPQADDLLREAGALQALEGTSAAEVAPLLAVAWIPAPFVPPHALGRLVERVHRSLKPGGWLLFAAAKPGEDLRGAALRFRVALYGGAPSTQQEIEKLLVEKGMSECGRFPAHRATSRSSSPVDAAQLPDAAPDSRRALRAYPPVIPVGASRIAAFF